MPPNTTTSAPPPWRDATLLVIACAIAYLIGPDIHGLTNWQEAQRLVVASEMHARGDWIVPTINGAPYLAKPPLIYWCQLLLAPVTGGVTLLALRLTVALAGLAGVLATWWLARHLTRDLPAPCDTPEWRRNTSLWSALFLASGVLYTRSSRIGELDILLVAPVVLAIGGLWIAWQHARERRWSPTGLALAAVGLTLSAMTKGPPGVLVPLLAWFGLVLHTLLRDRATLGPSLLRANPIPALIPAGLAFWGWFRAAGSRSGDEALASTTSGEVKDNLRLFVAEAPLNNLEAMSYGAGVGSIGAIIALIWLVKDRPKLGAAGALLLAWIGLSFIAFSVLGKGVARYLTPVWPGLSLLAGFWFASFLRDVRRPAIARTVMACIVAALILAQGWWYGFGREAHKADRSPRAFVRALLDEHPTVTDTLVGTFEFYTPAVDHSLGMPTQPVGNVGARDAMIGTTPWTLEMLVGEVDANGPMTLLIREGVRADGLGGNASDRLRDAGLIVTPLDVSAPFTIDSGRSPVRAVRVAVAPSVSGMRSMSPDHPGRS